MFVPKATAKEASTAGARSTSESRKTAYQLTASAHISLLPCRANILGREAGSNHGRPD